jgi:hypothetical protein
MRARHRQHGRCERVALRIVHARKARGKHHGCTRSTRAERIDQRGNGAWRCGDDSQVRRLRQTRHFRIGLQTMNAAVRRIHRVDGAGESACSDVSHHRRPHAARTVRRAYHRYRFRPEQELKVACAHAVTLLSSPDARFDLDQSSTADTGYLGVKVPSRNQERVQVQPKWESAFTEGHVTAEGKQRISRIRIPE